MEQALYGVILAVAAFLRLFALGGQPLNPLEAANAWPAWLTATAVTAPVATPPTSPLLHSLHTLFFWLTTGGDAVARLLPAVMGIGLVLLVWWWRAGLGRGVAILLALLLAVDPWLVAVSRLADGASLSVTLGVLTLTGLWLLTNGALAPVARQRWGYVTAVAAALLLVSGAVGWSFLPVLLLFVQLFSVAARPVDLSEPVDEALTDLGIDQKRSSSAPAAEWLGIPRLAWGVGGVAAVLGATTWLAAPEDISLISRSFSTWISYLSGTGASVYPLSWPFLRLWVDNPLLLVFGSIGIIQLWLGGVTTLAEPEESSNQSLLTDQRWRWFLTGWLLWSLLLMLLPGRNPLHLPMLGLPLAVIAASAGAGLFRHMQHKLPWLESGLLLGVLTVLLTFLTFSSWFLLAQWQWEMRRALVLLLFLALAVLLIIIFALWSNWPQTRGVVGTYVGLLLLLVTWSSSWQLNQWREPGEFNGFFAHFTEADVRRLAVDVHTLSAQRTGDATQMPVLVQMAAEPDPVLGWYLRDMYKLRWVLAPAVDSSAEGVKPLVITLGAEPGDDQQLVGYMGSRYALRGQWLPTQLTAQINPPATDPAISGLVARLEQFWSGGARVFLRWVVYRKVTEPPPTEQVILWVGQ